MFKFLGQMKGGRASLITVLCIMVVAVVFSYFLPADPVDYGAASLAPAIFLVVYIFMTKRILEALILASLVGFIMVSRPDTMSGLGSCSEWFLSTVTSFSESLLNVMLDPDTPWLIIVCGLMGSIVALIERTGGSFAFAEWLSKFAKTRKSALMCTYVLGWTIFIDDYLNALTVGSCMAPLTDKHKVPREFLAYVVDSTAAPDCTLIPISTWAVFCARILEENGWAPAGEGLFYFIKTIPFNFYGWIALIMVPLLILGVIPQFGPMKKAEERVKNGGPLAPPGSEKISIHNAESMELPDNPKLMNLFIPIGVLIGSTIYFDIDMSMGVLFTLGFMFVFYLAQGLMSAEEFTDLCMKGLENMMMPLMLMVLAFLFAAVNDSIHFTEYLINSATQFMSPQLMPLIVFLLLGFTEFITGTNWGMYIIALPIVIPLAMNIEANVALCVAAVLSAGVFGSHVCFYSDATVISSAACGCDNFRHSITQAPYGLVGASISALLFLGCGFLLG